MDKRELAKLHRGVWYDARIDKFIAEIYVEGRKQYLGSFADAGDAGDAYRAADRARPPVAKAPTFSEVVKPLEPLKVGDEVEFRGQVFEFVSVQFRRPNGRALPFFEWRSHCCECGVEYDTLASAGGARSITRRCLAHRKAFGGKKAVREPKVIDLQPTLAAYEMLHGDLPEGKFSEITDLLEFLRKQHRGVWAGDREAYTAYVLWRKEVREALL